MVTKNKVFVSLSCDVLVFEYAFDFYVTKETDISCVHVSAINVVTELVNPTHFSVASQDWRAGGTVTLVDSFAGGDLIIYRTSDFLQEDNLINDPSMEAIVDKLTAQVQELKERVDQCVRAPVGETGEMELPIAEERESVFIGTDVSGNIIPIAGDVDTSVIVSSFMETLLDDTTAAGARTTLEVLKDDHNHDARYYTETEVDTQTTDLIKTYTKTANFVETASLLGTVETTYFVTVGTGNLTGELPDDATAGQIINVVQVDDNTGDCTLSVDGTDTINGEDEWKLNGQHQRVRLQYDGVSDYKVISCLGTLEEMIDETVAPITFVHNTWTNVSGHEITIGPGTWEIYYEGMLAVSETANNNVDIFIYSTLTTTKGTQSINLYARTGVYSGTAQTRKLHSTHQSSATVTVTTSTTYYLEARFYKTSETSNVNTFSWYGTNGQTKIIARRIA